MAEKASPTPQSGLRVVILNQYYAPDVASTGHLLHELAEDLAARGVRVSVMTSRPSYGPKETWLPCPRREFTNGVDVTRMFTTRFSKDNLLGRLINSITFLLPLFLRMLFRRDREEVFLYTTNPPYLGIIGALVSMLRRHPYLVLLHDSYPHLAVWVGKIRGKGIIERIWHRLNRLIYRRAKQTIVLCDAARSLVCRDYAIEPTRVHVIPNWADGAKLFPMPKTDSSIAKMTGAADHFTVMYSGNLGLYYEFETILGAAERLKDTSFRLILTGSGGKRDWIAGEIKRRGLNNTLLLPYQPFDRLNESLNACDASLVTIAQGIEGISFPSKLYSSLAVGRPILAISEPNSDLQRIVESEKVGHWFALGDSESVASRIRQMIDRPAECAQAGANARSLFLRMFTIQASGARYAEVLALAASSGDAP